MASTFSDLKIELIGTGEQAGTWGSTTNTNLGTALQEAITGSADVAFSSGDVTLTLTNSNGAQVGRNLRLNLTGTSSGALNLILGAEMQVEKLYLINNTLADAVTVKNTTGTGIAVPAGKSMFVFNDGTNVVDAINLSYCHLTTGTLVATTADIERRLD
jgi:DNA-binding beta-propeller fold protein YncE